MGEALAIEGSTDAELFEAYVEEFLARHFKPGRSSCSTGWGRAEPRG